LSFANFAANIAPAYFHRAKFLQNFKYRGLEKDTVWLIVRHRNHIVEYNP
jgi:hypothetical protein